MEQPKSSGLRLLWLTAAIVGLDQATKMLVRGFVLPGVNMQFQGIPLGDSREVIGNFLRLTHIENPGMAFGLDFGFKPLFSLFSVLASVVILLYLIKMRHASFSFRLALCLILGGAFGNLIDRVFYGVFFDYAPLLYGRVVDFIDVDFFNVSIFGLQFSRWPVFNVADASVTVGVVMLLFARREPSAASDAVHRSDGEAAAAKSSASSPPTS